MKVAFLGGGNMASAIVGGLVARDFPRGDLLVVEIDSNARTRITASFGVKAIEAPTNALSEADVIVLAVKPQKMREVAASIAPFAGNALVLSVAAGIRIADLSRWLSGHERIVRAMPNIPALVHAGVTGLFALPSVSEEHRQAAETLLSAVGAALWFDHESDLDAVTAVSGSGPAYVFYAMEALETAARELGIKEGAARSLALWTFVGAAKLAIERAEGPAALRAQVTSKAGTTERAIEVLERAEVKARFVEAVKAACERSRELGAEYGEGLTLLSQAVAFVLETIFDLFILAVLVRFWMQAFRAPVRNPLAQFTIALTDFAVKPLRRVVPGIFKLDLSSILLAWFAEFVLQVLLLFVFGFAITDNPGVLSAVLFLSLVKLVRLSIYVFMGAIIIQAVLSWFATYHPVAPFFEALSRPFLRPIQRALPTIGGVDVSPVVVLIAFQLILMLPVAWLEGQTGRLVTRAFM